ncbi:hypothetical protein niasHT_011405 [Heterodera trifolii]|uniref:Cysteine-rich DPF motif domain-containing protein 1 n=1 Tax=Heterodera trifolii TaxID=157864 RepID=A0ABD2LKY9_9BILA
MYSDKQTKTEEKSGQRDEQKSAVTLIGSSSAENLEEFCCSNPDCQLSLKCSYGKLEFEKNSCVEPSYYMRNPFEPPNFHKSHRDYSLDDFVIVGSRCFICEQQICVDEECSLFYKHTFCLRCVWRERHSFPSELVAQAAKSNRREKERKATKE